MLKSIEDLSKKSKVNVSIIIVNEFSWICLNKQDYEHALGPKCAKILNIANSEYGRIFDVLTKIKNKVKQS